ncbi:MAG: hypothetical protein U0941_16320 [Planctomycetaceae bacterium]
MDLQTTGSQVRPFYLEIDTKVDGETGGSQIQQVNVVTFYGNPTRHVDRWAVEVNGIRQGQPIRMMACEDDSCLSSYRLAASRSAYFGEGLR